MDNDNNQIMILSQTLHHHTAGINTVALSPDGNRLLSAGDDADIVVWNTLTGEKMQVISAVFHGPVGALVWVPQQPGMSPGFAFGCADGSIHVYQLHQSSSNYQYFAQELVHGGPIMDIKFDPKFGRLASVGNGFPQVSELSTTEGKILQPIVPSPTSSQYNVSSIQFCDDGASVLVCTLETHKIECFSIEPWVLKWSKQIRTRIAHADLKDNYLAVANLHDGVDLYSIPNMQLIKTYSHGNANNSIFKVSFVDSDWLVSGGQDGFARLYDVQSGQFLQKMEHGSVGELLQTVTSHSQSETTMVITATSAIKIWTRKQQEEPISMPGSRVEGYPPSSGLSMKQMLTLLLFTTLLNFALAYSQALLNSWFWDKLATTWDNAHGLFPFTLIFA